MQLDELKRSMSTLEQVLAKTDTDINIDVSASKTAQAKILKKFKNVVIYSLILATIFGAAAATDINPLAFPRHLKIFLAILLVINTIWYAIMYRNLKSVDIAVLSPAKLFAKTASMKLWMLSSEVAFTIGLAVFFTLLFPNAWAFHRFGFWAMTVGLVAAIIYNIVHLYPQYIKLFRDLNTIKE